MYERFWLPSDSSESLLSKPKSKRQVLPPPYSSHTLHFNSTKILSGLLNSSRGIEYAIATAATRTVISCPKRLSNIAVIEWEEGWVDTEGSRLCLAQWVGGPNWGYSSTHVFKQWGNNPGIKWQMRNGNWQATNLQKQTLATFVVRRGTLTSRFELTGLGKPFADALVLTGILCVAGKKEWKWYKQDQAGRDVMEIESWSSAEWIGTESGTLSGEALPTYQEAPFTRCLQQSGRIC